MRVYVDPNSPISLMGFDRNPRGGRRMLGESRPYKRRPVINVTSVMADDSFRSVLLRAIRNSIHPGYTFECVFHQCIGMCSSTSIKIQPFRGVVKSDTHTQTLHTHFEITLDCFASYKADVHITCSGKWDFKRSLYVDTNTMVVYYLL